MLIDTHCHLDQLDDPGGAVRDARAAGVERIVAVSEDLRSMQAVLRLRDRHPETVVPALGIHPQLIPHLEEAAVEAAFAFLEAHLAGAAMLGEVGLDFKHATTADEQERQERWLLRQLELAARLRKPVNLHSRRALRRVLRHAIAYRERSGCAAQLHWFTQSKRLVRLSNEGSLFVSAGPSVLHGGDAAAVAVGIDARLLLTETDCPVPFNGASARPAWIPLVLAQLAARRGVPAAELETQVEANFERLLAGAASGGAGRRRHGPAAARADGGTG